MKEVTVEQFARWSFEYDREELGSNTPSFEHLTDKDKQIYLEDAQFELSRPSCTWPLGIKKLMSKNNDSSQT